MKLHFDTNVVGFVPSNEKVIFHQVSSIQGDNGELKTTSVASYLMRKRIVSRYTQPYHPESNGMSERAFRTIYELATSMLVHAGLPEPYWQWATSYACMVIDITPNQTLDGMAREAYFKWLGQVFDYSKLRTFGSRSYVHSQRVSDMLNKSEKGIFVGFESNERPKYTYRIFLTHKNSVVYSGDVTFYVGRAEPEKLLPPIIELQQKGTVLDIDKYQNLVDTIHFDNKEGVSYLVKKVYI